MSRPGLLLAAVALACTSGCAYPRRTTPLSIVSRQLVAADAAPENVWGFVLVSADIPPRQRSGLAWDDDNGKPDPFLKLLIDGRLVWQSPELEDTENPHWEARPPKNLAFERSQRVRLELWDKDGLSSDPIGIYEGKVLSDAIIGADTIVKLEGGADVTVRLERPEAHVGTGIALYETRKDALVLLEIMPDSPASRAGLKAGDRITAIDGEPISNLGAPKAESALALAAQKQSELTVQRGKSYERVKLDSGYVWITM